MRDDDLRNACFDALRRLAARHGPDIPYRGGLEAGFQANNRRIPFMTPYKGIFRAREQQGPAALSIISYLKSPYRDRATADGYVYSYRAGSIEQPDNHALREAFRLNVPVVYFFQTRAGHYDALFPWFVDADDPIEREVHVTPGVRSPLQLAAPLEDAAERQYVFRQARVRVHQRRFRGAVLPAYGEQCAICRLKEPQLLDAAHIAGDLEERGDPVVSNGLSLCSIHHRAFDENLVGVSPNHQVHVAPRLLEDEDGPMLELLKGFDGQSIVVPERRTWQPDRERLAVRFDRFVAAY
jgi:putative restriction endonuclease